MLRYFFFSFFLAVVAVIVIAGFRGEKSGKSPLIIFPDMDFQPRYDPQHKSGFYADGRAARKAPEGTVPQGYVQPGDYSTTQANNARGITGPQGFSNNLTYSNTGRIGEFWGTGIPEEIEVNPAFLARGQERYTINCAMCHGAVGDGKGIVSQYGLVGVANIHDSRIRTMPDGQIFEVITHGKGNMGAYGANITVEDRWAIIAYMHALQRSQNSTLEDVPAQFRTELDKQ